MIRWKLKEIMARYDIRGIDLAKEMSMTEAAVSNLRNSKTIPRIGGDKFDLLVQCLSKLANTPIYFSDLYEENYAIGIKFPTAIG